LRLSAKACLLGALLGANAHAAAQAPPLLTLGLARCPAVSPYAVQTMVGVELRRPVLLDDGVAPAEPDARATTAVRVSCHDLRAVIQIDDLLTGKTLERVVDLAAAAPVARPHLLALSIVELLAASWIELESNPQPVVPTSPSPAVSSEARAAALEVIGKRAGPHVGPALFAAAVAQTSTTHVDTWGAALVLGGTLSVRLGWRLDMALQHGDETVALGRVSVDLASAGGSLVAQLRRGRATFSAGLGARTGRAWLTGTPNETSPAIGATVRGLWWGPVTVVGASVALWRRLAFELSVEAGHVIVPVVALVQGSPAVAIDGTWLRGGAGVGVAF
jgi:hypothetical protein